MDNENKNKNSMREDREEIQTIKVKIFNYFYFILKDQKEINRASSCIFIIIEMIQLLSFAFADPNKETWKISEKKMKLISSIIGAPRIAPLMRWVSYDIYIIIFFIILVLMFLLCLLMAMQVLFANPSSKIYRVGVSFVRHFINPLTILLTIPAMELVLMPLKCKDGVIDTVKDGIQCWKKMHYLYAVLGIVVNILFVPILFIMITFYFSPFQIRNSTTKISGERDSFLFLIKLIFILQHLIIRNQYLSVVITLLLSSYNFVSQYSEPTYNNFVLQIFVHVRNSVVFWTYFVLFIFKLLDKTRVDGAFYLLIFGYPVIMYFSYIYYKKIEGDFKYTSANFNNIKDYMEKTRYMVKLVESYIDNGKGLRYGRELVDQKNDILLKGLINQHEEQCIDDDCPMKKFLENSGNYNVQKLCLLNHMNNHFTFGIKQFPESRELLISYIQFNYSKKFNLNSVRTHLGKIQRLTNSLIQDFIIFSMEQDIKQIKNKFGDEGEAEQEIDAISQKYQRLKFLIENSTKLYGEFWGIFATNVTNNLNTIKLYSLGEKLNKYLNEINDIWENQLKGKKIELENQSVAQLYSRFLKEILWDKKRSEEIQKKLNDEHHRHHEAKKIMEEGPNIGNFDYILENQDFVIFANSNEKGLCNIVQCSNSIVYLLGFLKKEIIGKPIEFIMPSIFVDGHAKMLEGHIKKMHSNQNSQRDSFRASDKKETFLLPKSKMGYLSPLNAKFTVYDDNDFSNNFVIKVKMEAKDTKSVYAYYVLTKPDFSIDSISSSALNLGLSMDLLKKYVVKMSVLVRDQNQEINLFEEHKNYQGDPKEVTWVFPEIIYPKNDSQRSREDILEQLIEKSPKKQILLQIIPMNYDDNLIGYVFKFTEVNQKKIQSELNKVNINTKNEVIKYNQKKEVLFDVKRLGYVRTVLVEQKTGFHNLRDEELEKDLSEDSISNKKKSIDNDEDEINNKEDSDDENKKDDIIITKEKILELQQLNAAGVKAFIEKLSFYGNDVSLERHRPTKEKYAIGRAEMPNIRIDIKQFEKSIEEKIKNSPELMKRLREGNKDDAGNKALANAAGEGADDPQKEKTAEELSREFSSDTSSSLANIFNAKSITYIKSVNVIIFLVICAFITIEFILSYLHIQNINDYRYYMDNGYKLLHNLLYTKYFLTEAMSSNLINNYLGFDKDTYIQRMNSELSTYRSEYVDLYNSYSSATVSFNDDYKRVTNSYIYKRSISISTKEPTNNWHPFSTEMNQISTAVYFVSTSTNYTKTMNMKEERYAYELMANLLNGYYSKWGEVTDILVQNVKEHCSKTSGSSTIHILIFVLSIVVSVLFLILFWKVLIIFIEDRERPINLFLTIKKKIFEDLKNSAEGFSNKLLNKVFGNEDNDEESQQDYQANIKVNDINIVKFTAKNDYRTSVNKDKTHLFNYLRLVIFFLVFLFYMSFKFGYFMLNIQSMSNFIDVYNITQNCQTNTLYTVDVIKSYLFDSNIQILDNIDNPVIFINTYKSISDKLEQMIIETSRTPSFLEGQYQQKFREYLNSDFTEIIKKKNVDYISYYKEGLKKSIMRQYDILKYISLRRLTYNISEDSHRLLNETEWIELNNLVENIIRPWFIGLVQTLNERFEDFYDGTRLVQISVFIALLVVIILIYFIMWRNYEESLKSLLKISFDLINLIPEEIKYLIVLKINE